MRHRQTIAVTIAALGLPVVLAAGAPAFAGHRASLAPAIPPPAAASAALPVRAQIVSCRSALDGPSRAVVFSGDMRAIPGSARLDMRFELLARGGASRREQVVVATGLGTWISSEPGKARLRYRKRIENLAAPGSYRARVSFRWVDARGTTLAFTVRRTPACQQHDLRPNLQVVQVGGRGVDERTAAYTVQVRNSGRTAAPAFAVALAVPGTMPLRAVVPALGPGARMTVTMIGRRCPVGGALMATADVDGQVAERREDDNTLTLRCPAAAELATTPPAIAPSTAPVTA